jgi:hypothetical protein
LLSVRHWEPSPLSGLYKHIGPTAAFGRGLLHHFAVSEVPMGFCTGTGGEGVYSALF